jgi:hypothetical protein
MKLGFSRHSFEKSTNINFMKIGSVLPVLFHADRRTDRHGEVNLFANFAKAPKNEK